MFGSSTCGSGSTIVGRGGETIDKGSKISSCVVGTLSPSDADSVGPVGPCGTVSPSDTDDVGPMGPDGTLSSPDLAGNTLSGRTCWVTIHSAPCWPLWDAVPI